MLGGCSMMRFVRYDYIKKVQWIYWINCLFQGTRSLELFMTLWAPISIICSALIDRTNRNSRHHYYFLILQKLGYVTYISYWLFCQMCHMVIAITHRATISSVTDDSAPWIASALLVDSESGYSGSGSGRGDGSGSGRGLSNLLPNRCLKPGAGDKNYSLLAAVLGDASFLIHEQRENMWSVITPLNVNSTMDSPVLNLDSPMALAKSNQTLQLLHCISHAARRHSNSYNSS